MSMDLLERSQPLVFIVEDKPDSLRKRVDFFESFDCVVLGAGSRDEALRELGSTPLIDLLVTDIHMADDSHPNDKSGIELARAVRAMWADIPIAGYSAKFAEDELSHDERGAFDITFAKGRLNVDDLLAQTQACVALAQRHRLQRAADRDEALARLRREFAVTVPSADVLRRFEPDGAANVVIEAQLLRAGYRLQLVSASSQRALRESFPVWLVSGEGGWEVEVYGHPELYAFGTNESDAVDHLVELMALVAAELRAARPATRAVEQLADFLARTLG